MPRTGRPPSTRKCPSCGRGTYAAGACWRCRRRAACLVCKGPKAAGGSYCPECRKLLDELADSRREPGVQLPGIRRYEVGKLFPRRAPGE